MHVILSARRRSCAGEGAGSAEHGDHRPEDGYLSDGPRVKGHTRSASDGTKPDLNIRYHGKFAKVRKTSNSPKSSPVLRQRHRTKSAVSVPDSNLTQSSRSRSFGSLEVFDDTPSSENNDVKDVDETTAAEQETQSKPAKEERRGTLHRLFTRAKSSFDLFAGKPEKTDKPEKGEKGARNEDVEKSESSEEKATETTENKEPDTETENGPKMARQRAVSEPPRVGNEESPFSLVNFEEAGTKSLDSLPTEFRSEAAVKGKQMTNELAKNEQKEEGIDQPEEQPEPEERRIAKEPEETEKPEDATTVTGEADDDSVFSPPESEQEPARRKDNGLTAKEDGESGPEKEAPPPKDPQSESKEVEKDASIDVPIRDLPDRLKTEVKISQEAKVAPASHQDNSAGIACPENDFASQATQTSSLLNVVLCNASDSKNLSASKTRETTDTKTKDVKDSKKEVLNKGESRKASNNNLHQTVAASQEGTTETEITVAKKNTSNDKTTPKKAKVKQISENKNAKDPVKKDFSEGPGKQEAKKEIERARNSKSEGKRTPEGVVSEEANVQMETDSKKKKSPKPQNAETSSAVSAGEPTMNKEPNKHNKKDPKHDRKKELEKETEKKKQQESELSLPAKRKVSLRKVSASEVFTTSLETIEETIENAVMEGHVSMVTEITKDSSFTIAECNALPVHTLVTVDETINGPTAAENHVLKDVKVVIKPVREHTKQTEKERDAVNESESETQTQKQETTSDAVNADAETCTHVTENTVDEKSLQGLEEPVNGEEIATSQETQTEDRIQSLKGSEEHNQSQGTGNQVENAPVLRPFGFNQKVNSVCNQPGTQHTGSPEQSTKLKIFVFHTQIVLEAMSQLEPVPAPVSSPVSSGPAGTKASGDYQRGSIRQLRITPQDTTWETFTPVVTSGSKDKNTALGHENQTGKENDTEARGNETKEDHNTQEITIVNVIHPDKERETLKSEAKSPGSLPSDAKDEGMVSPTEDFEKAENPRRDAERAEFLEDQEDKAKKGSSQPLSGEYPISSESHKEVSNEDRTVLTVENNVFKAVSEYVGKDVKDFRKRKREKSNTNHVISPGDQAKEGSDESYNAPSEHRPPKELEGLCPTKTVGMISEILEELEPVCHDDENEETALAVGIVQEFSTEALPFVNQKNDQNPTVDKSTKSIVTSLGEGDDKEKNKKKARIAEHESETEENASLCQHTEEISTVADFREDLQMPEPNKFRANSDFSFWESKEKLLGSPLPSLNNEEETNSDSSSSSDDSSIPHPDMEEALEMCKGVRIRKLISFFESGDKPKRRRSLTLPRSGISGDRVRNLSGTGSGLAPRSASTLPRNLKVVSPVSRQTQQVRMSESCWWSSMPNLAPEVKGTIPKSRSERKLKEARQEIKTLQKGKFVSSVLLKLQQMGQQREPREATNHSLQPIRNRTGDYKKALVIGRAKSMSNLASNEDLPTQSQYLSVGNVTSKLSLLSADECQRHVQTSEENLTSGSRVRKIDRAMQSFQRTRALFESGNGGSARKWKSEVFFTDSHESDSSRASGIDSAGDSRCPGWHLKPPRPHHTNTRSSPRLKRVPGLAVPRHLAHRNISDGSSDLDLSDGYVAEAEDSDVSPAQFSKHFPPSLSTEVFSFSSLFSFSFL